MQSFQGLLGVHKHVPPVWKTQLSDGMRSGMHTVLPCTWSWCWSGYSWRTRRALPPARWTWAHTSRGTSVASPWCSGTVLLRCLFGDGKNKTRMRKNARITKTRRIHLLMKHLHKKICGENQHMTLNTTVKGWGLWRHFHVLVLERGVPEDLTWGKQILTTTGHLMSSNVQHYSDRRPVQFDVHLLNFRFIWHRFMRSQKLELP